MLLAKVYLPELLRRAFPFPEFTDKPHATDGSLKLSMELELEEEEGQESRRDPLSLFACQARNKET